MKKLILSLLTLILILSIALFTVLATTGLKTSKFNKLISDKAAETNNIDLSLKTIQFKLDPKKFSLFLETENPIIKYRDISIPVKNIKVYIDFFSFFKSDLEITKINLVLEELNVTQLNKLSAIIKPSNLKSFLDNKIKSGKIFSEIEIFLNKKGIFENFITRGKVKNLNTKLLGEINLTKANFSFFADRSDMLFKNISGEIEGAIISDGDIKIEIENGIKLNSNFKSSINLDKRFFEKDINIIKKNNLLKKIKILKGKLNNSLNIELDKTYKVLDYNYNFSGNITIKDNSFTKEKFDEVFLSNVDVKALFSPKNIELNGEGKYSFNNSDFFKINLIKKINNDLLNLKINFDFINDFNIDLINYQKPKNSIANISIDLDKKKENLKINKIDIKENENFIKLTNLIFKKDIFLNFGEVSVKTLNNDFSINNDKKIQINGKKFDATNLLTVFNNQSTDNKFKKFSKEIVINLNSIQLPMSEKLKNFKLIGEISKGNFVKISSKGDFDNNSFLDISMKKDKNSNKKYLEIYSDLTQPLLSEYNFFKGLTGGKLLYTSIINDSNYNSKLKIENFKIVNAPGVVKLLSLADLGGLADLAAGDGLSFELLEIDMEKSKGFLRLNEILALGPSMSVLMEGYQDKNGLTSIRGTLVPAKTLNRLISKIPVIGNIVIPKEAGEGLFGISFKMKGPKGNIKTTINPIRTLTPRFIQKIIDKKKTIK